MERKELKVLLETALKKSHFQFNGTFFDQIDGVAMGSPLGPDVADMFMIWFENLYMEIIKAHGVVLWLRFVDDVFILIEDNDSFDKANELMRVLNSKHPNIEFTMEKETNNELPFLDVLIKRDTDSFQTGMYRKATFTGTYMNWKSLTPRSYKIGLIRCLLTRAFRICSTEKLFREEISNIKKILLKNSYPAKLVSNNIRDFIRKNKAEKQVVELAQKPKVYLVLPYFTGADDLKRRITDLVHDSFPQVDFRLMFKAHDTLGNHFNFKDKTSKEMVSKIVYRLNCLDCEKFYVGQSIRHLGKRKEEHMGDINSSVCKHAKSGHRIDWENIEILDKAKDRWRLLLKEMLHINKLKPQLNIQKSSKLFSLIIGTQEDSGATRT